MLPIQIKHIHIITNLLKYRLARPTTIDIAVLGIHQCPKLKFDEVYNRFIGFFVPRGSSNPAFILVGREDPDGPLTHVFAYYINEDYQEIQESEISLLKSHIPYTDAKDSSLKFGLILARSSSHPSTYLSTLMEVVDYTLSTRLIDNFVSLQLIDTDSRDLALGSIPQKTLTYCKGHLEADEKLQFISIARRADLPLELYPSDIQPRNPEVVLVKTEGHFVGNIFSHETRVITHILVHPNQFQDNRHYARVRDLTQNWHTVNIEDFNCTRVYPNEGIKCTGSGAQVVLEAALHFRPHVLTVVQDSDFNAILNFPRPFTPEMPDRVPTFRRVEVSTRASQIGAISSQQSGSERTIKLCFDRASGRPAVLANYDSQATEIMPSSEIHSEMVFWKEVSSKRQRTKDSVVPPTHNILPYSDRNGIYLKILPSYTAALRFLSRIWSNYAPTLVVTTDDDPDDRVATRPEQARFILCQRISSEDSDCLVVVDREIKEWIFFQPGNALHKNSTRFDALDRPQIEEAFSMLKGYNCRVIPITSAFHVSYPRVHLLMSVYVMARLFRYSVALPQKVIYGEWEFRKYASNICNELQISNSEYNIKNRLVDEQGYLKSGAKVSYPCALLPETCVVPKDQCMFCKRRGFQNLGRHLSMQHGGQAMQANKSRLTFE